MQRITTSGLRSWWAWEGRRQGVAALAGLMWAMAFPEPGIAGLAWVAPGLMWHAAAGLGPAGAFRTGYVAGLVQALVSLRWLLSIPHPAGAVAGWLALSGYCAVYPGLWLLWGAWIRRQATGDAARPWREAAEAQKEARRQRVYEKALDACATSPFARTITRWVLAGTRPARCMCGAHAWDA
jgi:hypothetical protein